MIGLESRTLLEAARRRWDVVVVGAGPAGSIAARELARQGLGVLLVDKAAFPRWKVCGCCLNPFSLGILSRVGLGDLPGRCGGVPIRQLRLAVQERQADIALPGWQVLSRERLDLALAEAAITAGAMFLPSTQAALGPPSADARTIILRRDEQQERAQAHLIVAADGLAGGLLAHEPGCAVTTTPASRLGAGVVAERAPEFYGSAAIYMAYGRGGYVGLVRLEDGRLNIAAALDLPSLKEVHGLGEAAAQLIEEVGWPAVPNLTLLPWRGTPKLTRQTTRPASERVLAVGDAAGYVEPFTGEGIGWALASGAAIGPLARAAVCDWHPEIPARWTALQRHAALRQQRLCRAIAWLSRRPTLVRFAVKVLNWLPSLAVPLVNRVPRAC